MTTERGVLPKAYLRISPDLDQHEDPEAMVLLICAANRQTPRGRFKSRAIVERVIGRKRFAECVRRSDLVRIADGAWYLDGWDEWQEGDHTVGERMRRLRAKRAASHSRNGVTDEPSPSDDPPEGSQPSHARNAVTTRRLGVKASRRQGASSVEDRYPDVGSLVHIGEAGRRLASSLRPVREFVDDPTRGAS